MHQDDLAPHQRSLTTLRACLQAVTTDDVVRAAERALSLAAPDLVESVPGARDRLADLVEQHRLATLERIEKLIPERNLGFGPMAVLRSRGPVAIILTSTSRHTTDGKADLLSACRTTSMPDAEDRALLLLHLGVAAMYEAGEGRS
ncbi:hypothetical protein JYK14_24420 [Siccirubricoccus sp. KC 17139]|uniref:DUF2019 domain-containing protein n=1 Tax=Siccirubricoccus soli TaxID=2899147 RepID=A0ABT1DE77_9PROT|nr:hypothetical protein [Siccirubricoccus soli]MCO6419280.1 hypothetical protein [Siccirubricoccus soli]MCP2685415.1 hypothetical protein [Siccirubricoccus soli]